MEFPLKNTQLPARLTGEDLEFLNELLPELFPDRDLEADKTLTGREIIMQLAETAALKLRKVNQPRPEDQERIKQLEQHIRENTAEYNQLAKQSENDNAELKARQRLIDELTQMVAEEREKLAALDTDHSQVKEKAQKLEKYVPVPGEMRIVLEPLTSKVLALYAEKIRLRNKSEVGPGEILTTLFTRYITKRETELPGFPFLVSKQEIAALAQSPDNV